MNINIEELSSEFKKNIKFDYDLKKKNWFNIGGKTKIFYKADNLKDLIKFLKKIENKVKNTDETKSFKEYSEAKNNCCEIDNFLLITIVTVYLIKMNCPVAKANCKFQNN